MNYWQGEKVRLRGVEPADAAVFFRWNSESEMGRNFDFVWPPISAELVKQQVHGYSLEKLKDDAFRWIIEDQRGIAVGSITTHHCDRRNGSFGYGINVAPEHRGKGYATDAIKLVVTYYFEELRYHKVSIEVFSHNTASIALHEKIGFVKEGALREMIYTGGQYFDLLYYGATCNEWEKMNGKE